MYFYRDKGLLLQRLHPVTTLSFIGVLMLVAVMYTNPLFLLGILIVAAVTAKELEGWEQLISYLKVGSLGVLFILFINPILSHEGQTILWNGPHLHVLGEMNISLEALLYGLNMGLKLVVLSSTFCLYNLMMDPDEAMSFFAQYAQKSATVVALTTRLIPSQVMQARNVAEVHRARGVKLEAGNWLHKWRTRLPFLKIMLLSSLENSWQIAEAMEARAFGSGCRSYYGRRALRQRDYWILLSTAMAAIVAMYAFSQGIGKLEFYPVLGKVWGTADELVWLIVMSALAMPAVLARGCKQWRFLKQKI